MTTEPREPGWYWVKLNERNPWCPFEWDGDRRWICMDSYHQLSPDLVIGPRIPTPDEITNCPECGHTAHLPYVCGVDVSGVSGVVPREVCRTVCGCCAGLLEAKADAAGANPSTLGTLDEG